jgi:7-cyano-7-deazaguanine synthase in queuosine biosynthesis
MEEVSQIEDILEEKRGFVSKVPDKAVFLFSGGPDSTFCMAYCMEELGLEIYPLFVRRGQGDILEEEESVDFFNDLLKEKYPEKYNDVQKIDAQIPPFPVKKDLPKDWTENKGYPLRDNMMLSYGVQYATSLDIRSILIGTMPSDSFPHTRLEAFKAHTLNVCISTGTWNWNITAPVIDPKFGEEFEKQELIDWAEERGLPREKTIST